MYKLKTVRMMEDVVTPIGTIDISKPPLTGKEDVCFASQEGGVEDNVGDEGFIAHVIMIMMIIAIILFPIIAIVTVTFLCVTFLQIYIF